MIALKRKALPLLLLLSMASTSTGIAANAAERVMEITAKEAFVKEVVRSKVPVLVDFYATWCGPCQRQGPIVESLAKRYGKTVKFAKLDVDRVPDTAARYGVTGLPMIAIFKKGKLTASVVGLHSKEELAELLSGELRDR